MFLKSFGRIFKCFEMRLISFGVKVGVMVLQQLAQLKQSTSCQTSVLSCSARISKPSGFNFSTRRKYF